MPLLADGFDWWAHATPDKVAVTFEGDELTYAHLGEWSDRVARDLRERGVAVGDRVAVMAGNGIEYCVATVAIFKAAAVAVPFSTRLTPGELKVITDACAPKVVFCDESTVGPLQDADSGAELVDLSTVTSLRDGAPAQFERTRVDPDEPGAIIYTSGTTGTPKGVIYTNSTMLGTIHEWGLTERGFKHDMRQIWVLPLGGAPGMIWGIVHTFHRGATFVLHRAFKPAEALQTLQDAGITSMVGVPILYEQIAAQPGWAEAEFSEWETAHVGGARVSEELLRTYAAKGVLLRQIYGMTEAGGSASVNSRERALTNPELCGQGGPYTRIRVVRDDGSDCEAGETGEILIKGPSVTPGYWGNPEATEKAIVDGWMHSGDLGVLDEQGDLRMVDRLKDLIISGGLNIAPAEIENVIAELPEVAEVAVIAALDAKFGETPAAIVRLSGELEPADIVAHCNTHLADFKVPRYVVVVDEPLPRMASGKVAKRELRSAHADIAESYEKLR